MTRGGGREVRAAPARLLRLDPVGGAHLNFMLPRLMPGNPALAMLAKYHGRVGPGP